MMEDIPEIFDPRPYYYYCDGKYNIIFNCNATTLSQTNKECFKNYFFHSRKSFCNDGTCPWSQKRKTGWHWQIGLNFEDKQPSSGQIPCRFTIDWNCHNSVTHPLATRACLCLFIFLNHCVSRNLRRRVSTAHYCHRERNSFYDDSAAVTQNMFWMILLNNRDIQCIQYFYKVTTLSFASHENRMAQIAAEPART